MEISSWLKEQMDRNNINALSLSYALRISHVTIGKWLKGTYTPSPRSCRKIASFFGIPEEDILTIAGHLRTNTIAEPKAPYDTRSPALGEAIHLFNALDDDDQERILIYMRALRRSQTSENRRTNSANVQESPAPG